MEETQTLGMRMQQRRLSLGLTQQQVADAAGITKSAMSRYEGDAFETPREVVVCAIAAALHTSPAWLMCRTQDPTPPAHTSVSDTDLKFALFGGGAPVITDAQFAEVKRFAEFIKERDRIDDT